MWLTRYFSLHRQTVFRPKNAGINIFRTEDRRRTLPAACHEALESRIIAGEQAIRRPP